MYKDPLMRENPPEISLNPYIHNLEVNNNMPLNLIKGSVSVKSNRQEYESAFDRAAKEEEIVKENEKKKNIKFMEGLEFFEREMTKKKTEDKLKLQEERASMESKLRKIIHDTLKFSKKNTPLLAMMPQQFTDAINLIAKERGVKKGTNVLNLSNDGSLNFSFTSKTSAKSVAKYESNAFLKMLGLELNNLTPGNIVIQIDKAQKFIDRWSVKDKNKINQIIRYKVVNEIMNVEERRSVQKLARINKRLKSYINNQRSRSKKTTNNSLAKKIDDISVISKDKIDTEETPNESLNKLTTKESDANVRKTRIKDGILNKNEFWKSDKMEKKVENRGDKINVVDNEVISFQNVNEKKALKKIEEIDRPKTSFRTKEKKIPKFNVTSHTKNVKAQDEYSFKPPKKKIMLDAYNKSDRICNFINSRPELKKNQNLTQHFTSLKKNKEIDNLTARLMNKNRIGLVDYHETEY